eukprot:gene20267-1059_t
MRLHAQPVGSLPKAPFRGTAEGSLPKSHTRRYTPEGSFTPFYSFPPIFTPHMGRHQCDTVFEATHGPPWMHVSQWNEVQCNQGLLEDDLAHEALHAYPASYDARRLASIATRKLNTRRLTINSHKG